MVVSWSSNAESENESILFEKAFLLLASVHVCVCAVRQEVIQMLKEDKGSPLTRRESS